MKAIIIVSHGNSTEVFVDGVVYGNGITEISFNHTAAEKPSIEIKADRLPVEGEKNLDKFRQTLDFLISGTGI